MLDKNMGMDNCIFKYVKYLNLLNKSEATIKSYVSTLQKFVKDEKINEVNEFVGMDKEFWFKWVDKQKDEENISIATINKKIKQMSSFYNFLVNEGLLNDNCLYRFPKINETTLKSEYKGDKIMSNEEAKAILKAIKEDEFNCHTNYINKRNQVIVEILLGLALRIDEVSKIQIQDIVLEENKLYVRGKGKKNTVSRVSFYNDKIKEDLIELIRYNPNRIYLLTDRNFNQLKTQGIRNIWYDALKVAKIEKRYVPHNCRHTIASLLVEKNIPLKKVANILGHNNVSTVQRYYAKKVEDFRDDLNKVDIFD